MKKEINNNLLFLALIKNQKNQKK